MTTQREAFQAWALYWCAGGVSDNVNPRLLPVDPKPARVDALKAMRQIVDMAQNAPEHGGQSDGSFDAETWTLARDLVACMALLDRVEREIQDAIERLTRSTR